MTRTCTNAGRAAAYATVAVLAAVGGAAFGQGKAPRPQAAGGHHASFSGDTTPPMGIPLLPPANAWLTARWTGDSGPFDAAVRDIRRQAIGRGGTESAYRAVAAREKDTARRTPLDLLAQFRWLYASTQVHGGVDDEALQAVDRLDFGIYRTVERIRFAATVLAGPYQAHPKLAALEDRLMRSDPKDEWVKDHVIRDLTNDQATLPKAAALADRWVAESPRSAEAHGVRAYVALLQWFWGHRRDRALAGRIVAEYGAFLRYAPPDDPDRPDVEHMIAAVRKETGVPMTDVLSH